MDEQKLAELHQLIDEWAGGLSSGSVTFGTPIPDEEIPSARELPKDKRVIRTKSTGDRVYLIDEVAKTKQWVTAIAPKTGPDTIKELGFEMSDIEEVDDSELVGYAMQASIYKVD